MVAVTRVVLMSTRVMVSEPTGQVLAARAGLSGSDTELVYEEGRALF